jgi:hypothetical protein
MSWMDFKTAQALKAQKLASEGKRETLGTQKGSGHKAVGVSMDSISVQKATNVPKPSRRVQGVSKNARMTFAPGAINVSVSVRCHLIPLVACGNVLAG